MKTPHYGTPKKRSTRSNWWHKGFLMALAECVVVELAAKTAGISRRTAFRHRATDLEFAEAWDDAIDDFADSLELEAWQRAIEGVKRIRWVRTGTDDKGRPVFERIEEYEKSDVLLIFLLKGLRPEKYRENYDLAKVVSQLAPAASQMTIVK